MNSYWIIIFCVFFSTSIFAQSFQKVYGTVNDDEYTSMVSITNGDIVVSGTFYNGSNYDAIIQRIDVNGNFVWQKRYGGLANENSYVSTINNNGNIVIVGTTTEINGDLDIFVLEISILGQLQWQKIYAISGTDEIPRKVSLTNSGLAICGTIANPGSNSPDAIMFEVAHDGNIINWKNRIGVNTGYGDIPSSIIKSINGGYIVVGGTHNPATGYDQVIWRLNALGNLQSNIAFGSGNNENADDVIELANQDIIVMGNFRQLSGSGLEFALTSINSSDVFNWCRTYGDNSAKDERAYGYAKNANNGYSFCGYTNGRSGNDILLVETDSDGHMTKWNTFGDLQSENSSDLICNLDNSCIIVGYSESKGEGRKDGYVIKTDKYGDIENNCSFYNIVEKTINIGTHSYNYNEMALNLSIVSPNNIIASTNMKTKDFLCSTLSVELISFQANRTNNFVKIEWVSMNETNMDWYEIEKSFDTDHWTSITKVVSKNISTSNHYVYNDISSSNLASTVYYRLKKMEQNKSYSYSNVISLNPLLYINTYPNPVSNKIFIENNTEEILLDYYIADLIGNVMVKGHFTDEKKIEIDLDDLPIGIYILNYRSLKRLYTEKIIKK